MSKIEKEAIYFRTVDGNDIIKIPNCELNDNTDCLYDKSAIESTLAKINTTNQDTSELIQILEDSDNELENIQHVNQSIDNTNVVVYESTRNLGKKVSLDDESNNEGHKSNVLYYNKDYLMSGCNYNTKSNINVNLHKYKDHNYSDISNNEKLKSTLQSRKMLNNYANYNVPVSTSDNKNMFVSSKTALVSQVKNINDLKKVIPKVKILGAEVNTLKELTQANSNNKFNIMENRTQKMNDSRRKLDNYCRTCAGLKIPLVDIFSDRGVQMRLNQQMKHLENIDQQDSLSTQMCMDCICDLKMSYKFFMQIKKAEVKLKSIYATMNTSTSSRLIENQSNVKSENHSTNLYKSDNIWKIPNQLNQQQSLTTSVPSTNSDYIYDESGTTSKKLMVEPINNWKDNKHDNYDDAMSIEEFDPDDERFESIDYTNINTESDIGINNEGDTLKKQLNHNESTTINCTNTTEEMCNELINNISKGSMKKEPIGQLINIDIDNSIKVESENIVYETSPQSFTTIDRDIIRESVKQPNILKRKASWSGKCTNFVNTPDSSAKEAKIHKLNTVNISPSDEEGIMYVTVKGSKPNELLLVKVKKMDKTIEKKDDKNLVKKVIDLKSTEKPLKDMFCDRSKKLENREAIIEEQIEQYKKKREKVLGGGTGADAAAALIASASATLSVSNTRKSVDDDDDDDDDDDNDNDDGTLRFINFSNNFMDNSLLENETTLKVVPMDNESGEKENIEIKSEVDMLNDNEIDSQENNGIHNNEYKNTEDYLARLTVIKQKWEEAKLKKESLQKELDDSYTEGNLEKLSRILGEKEKNLQEFQEYLKQRKIVITRLKDEDIISLYEDRNITTMQNKLPDIIDENPTLYNIGDSNFFDCDYCSQIFSSRGALEEHLKTHDYKIPYFCEDCGSEFPNNKSRRAHNITCLKKLICKYCDFMLESKGKKRQHEQKHCDAIYGQLCDVCGEKFKHQGTLDQHIKTQHMSWEKVFQCPKCPKKFAFKQKLSFHLKSVHTTLRAYLCEDCGADFKNPASLRHHRIRKHQPTSNKRECPVCHKLVPFYSLSKHMYTHKAYTIECPHCDKMFKNTSTLKQHVRIHEDQRQYRCDTCGVGFNRRDGLRLHMRVHQKSDSRALKECSCQICSEKFPNHSMLVIHRNRVHKDGRQYTCHICNRSMLSTRSLEWHMSHIHNQTPTGITPDDAEVAMEMKRVSCSHCDKTFKTEMILRTHIKNTHMEKNPVKCSDCDLMFTSEVRLRHHMMIVHNRLEGTLTCPHCPKRFVNQLRLKTHMISHSEERPYTCEICGFNLKTKIQLIKHHQNRHSDERPLQCRYCPWRCKQVSALVCHERTHTNERPYSCIVCKQRFKYLGDKNKHERRHESLGGSGFKRIVAGRNVKQLKNQDGDVSASENDPLDQDYDNIDDSLNEQHVEYDIKYDDDQQIVKFEADEVDVQDQIEHHEQIIEEEEEDEEDEEEVDDYEDEGDEEEDEEQRQQHQQQVVEGEMDDEYKQVYQHEYEEISRETSDAAEVIMNMEDATVYTEEVTADNIENAEMITAEMMTNQILQSGTVVHIQQQDDDGKIQMIPVMLSLPDLTDSTAEINLATGSIIYNN